MSDLLPWLNFNLEVGLVVIIVLILAGVIFWKRGD